MRLERLRPYWLAMLTASVLAPRIVAAAACYPDTYPAAFQTDPRVSITACITTAARATQRGALAGVRFITRNNTPARLEIIYWYEVTGCGACSGGVCEGNFHKTLEPGEEHRATWTDGGSMVSSGSCEGSPAITARITKLKIIDPAQIERERQAAKEAAEREAQRKRADEEARQATQRRDDERRARAAEQARREQERQTAPEKERERQRAAAEQARQRERAQIRSSLDYIDGLQRQQKATADQAHAAYRNDSERTIARFSSDLDRNAAELEAEQATSAQRAVEIDRRIARQHEEVAASERRVEEARRNLDSTVDDMLSGLDDDTPPRTTDRVEVVARDGSNVRYSGAHASDVRTLLARSPTRWQTPSCKDCTDGVPPQIPSEIPCLRDKYVFAALQLAWAAESFTRAGEPSRAAEMASSMSERLRDASALCSAAPSLLGAPGCATMGVWPCP